MPPTDSRIAFTNYGAYLRKAAAHFVQVHGFLNLHCINSCLPPSRFRCLHNVQLAKSLSSNGLIPKQSTDDHATTYALRPAVLPLCPVLLYCLCVRYCCTAPVSGIAVLPLCPVLLYCLCVMCLIFRWCLVFRTTSVMALRERR